MRNHLYAPLEADLAAEELHEDNVDATARLVMYAQFVKDNCIGLSFATMNTRMVTGSASKQT